MVSEPLAITAFTTRHIREAITLRQETARAHQELHPKIFSTSTDEGALWRELHAYVPRWGWKKRHHFGLAAHRGDQFCGYLLYIVYSIQEPLFVRTPASLIVDIAVANDFRREGVGSALVNRYLHEAKARGAARFYANVWEGNTASSALFDKAGFNSVSKSYCLHEQAP